MERPRWVERLLHAGRVRGSTWAARHGPLATLVYELVVFGVKQAWACIFGALMLALLLSTHFYYPDSWPLARYDFLVISAISIQIALVVTRMESREEALVILIYHLVGTAMEIFKTDVGSWSYPEDSVLRIGGVPLFSGFMYASVGSYLARVWRLFDFRFTRYPETAITVALAVGIYVNFFSHHYVPDMRLALFACTILVFGPTWVCFRVDRVHRRMPLVIGFALVASFIWLAENFGTYARAWSYPDQAAGWEMVGVGKLGSWLLLMIVSFVLVALVHRRPAGSEH